MSEALSAGATGPGTPSLILVGVDVVDVSAARALGRSEDERFLQRVFAPSERIRIRESPEPDLELWRLWAAKEAAFKVVSKLLDPIPAFRHAAFRVMDDPGTLPSRLAYEGLELRLSLAHDEAVEPPRYVTATARNPVDAADRLESGITTVQAALEAAGWDRDDWRARAAGRFTPEELDPVHGLSSALVRLGARGAAAARLDVQERRLEIRCPPGHTGLRPPYLYLDGRRLRGLDVSLSHDGDHLAWALRSRSDIDEVVGSRQRPAHD